MDINGTRKNVRRYKAQTEHLMNTFLWRGTFVHWRRKFFGKFDWFLWQRSARSLSQVSLCSTNFFWSQYKRKYCNCIHAYQQCSVSRKCLKLNRVLQRTFEQNDICKDIAVRRHKTCMQMQILVSTKITIILFKIIIYSLRLRRSKLDCIRLHQCKRTRIEQTDLCIRLFLSYILHYYMTL